MGVVASFAANQFANQADFNSGASGFTHVGTAINFSIVNLSGRDYARSGNGDLRKTVKLAAGTTGFEMQVNFVPQTAGSTNTFLEVDDDGGSNIFSLTRTTSNYRINVGALAFVNMPDLPVVPLTPQRFVIRAIPEGGGVRVQVFAGGSMVHDALDVALDANGLNGVAGDILVAFKANTQNHYNDVLVRDDLSAGAIPAEYELTDHKLDPATLVITNSTGVAADITDSSLVTSSTTQGAASVVGTILGAPSFSADAILFSGAHSAVSAGASQTVLEVLDASDAVIATDTVDVAEVAPSVGNLGLVALPATTVLPGDTQFRFSTP